jgi:hypothetical protein
MHILCQFLVGIGIAYKILMSTKPKLGDIVRVDSESIGMVLAIEVDNVRFLALKGFSHYSQGPDGLYGFKTFSGCYSDESYRVLGNSNNDNTLAKILYSNNKRSK